ncbi:MAG: LamG-like jellyroll fold domain-containing protein [Crocinitomicaceae bacterium]
MKIVLGVLLTFSFLYQYTFGQNPGDTIIVHPFNWNMTYGAAWDGTIRDTTVTFPDNQSISFEKVIMLYNLRCRDNVVNTSGGNSIGCGEWDYSCNTYIYDSSHVDSTINNHDQFGISNFSATSFYYSNTALYNYIETYQPNVTLNSITSEVGALVGAGSVNIGHTLPTNQFSSKAQYLYSAADLTSAGFGAGTIDAIELNVISGSEQANFFRVLIKHTSNSVLDPSNPELTGFDTVYYHTKAFVTGTNRIQFAQPFNWDGTSNIIMEFSFTNTTPASIPVIIEGSSATDSCALYNFESNFITVSGNEDIEIPTSNLSTISNEITISFWANGNTSVLPSNTYILEGTDASNNRQVNIHFPWGNGNIYWDCGGNGSGGYDRINKAASLNEYAGDWSHWAFTKNAATGSMKIYRNGILWHSGTGLTNTIDVQNLILLASKSMTGNWSGSLREFRIFNAELNATTIHDWMNKALSASHPNYANLVAYYPLHEGTGSTISDLSTGGQTASINGHPIWEYQRGHEIADFFNVTNERPNIEFFQGMYNLTIANDTILDSIEHVKYNVVEYAVVPKWGTMEDDSIAAISDTLYTRSTSSKVYDEYGNQIRTIGHPVDGSIQQGSLEYYKRFPMRFEILSLVTPYGVNLDLGPNGETWIVDVSDFMPILTGNKRITVERGGQWQEDMDVQFLFIVGTPPRDVLDVQQIWRNDSKGYQAIMSNDAFEPRTLEMNPAGTYFKIRSVITGHGQEGEFIPQTHWLDVDGGNKEYSWQVWKECSENPIYPQGGTWIYDRAGWCPGAPSDLQEVDITAYVSAGSTHTLDYGINTAQGTSNYIVNNQLVTYGDPNFTLDASVIDIQGPSNYIEYKRLNPICANPKVRIRNTGATELNSLVIEYWINNDQNHQTYTWLGSMDFMEEELVELPSPSSLWDGIAGQTESKFHVLISQPNGGTDEYSFNNHTTSVFEIPEVLPSDFIFRLKTNNIAAETSYEIKDDQGNVILSRSGMSANTTYNDTMSLPIGCYQLIINDSGDNGLSFWANSDGSGFAQLRTLSGTVLKYFNPDFGRSIIYNFTIDFPLSYEDYMMNFGVEIYPNPAATQFTLSGQNIEKAEIQIFNAIGQQMEAHSTKEKNEVMFDASHFLPGIYLIHVNLEGRQFTKRLVIE